MNMISFKLNHIKRNVKKLQLHDEVGLSNALDNIRKIVSNDIFFDALSDSDIESKAEILSAPSQYSNKEIRYVENSDLNYFNTRTGSDDLIKDDVLDVIDFIKNADLA